MKPNPAIFMTLLMTTILLANCARKCPADITIAELNFSQTTRSFLPPAQKVSSMTFTNATGQTLVFKRVNDADWDKRAALPVETLCERGEFLDKTVQTADFSTESYHLAYATQDQSYTLNVDMMFNNSGMYGDRKDTIFYESFAAWGQKLTAPTRTGSVQVLSHERGNENYIRENIRESTNQFKIVTDTILLTKNIKNAWVVDPNHNHSLFIFYTKLNGIEAFTTETETWIRTQ